MKRKRKTKKRPAPRRRPAEILLAELDRVIDEIRVAARRRERWNVWCVKHREAAPLMAMAHDLVSGKRGVSLGVVRMLRREVEVLLALRAFLVRTDRLLRRALR